MKQFKIKFKHTDTSIRVVNIEAFNKERAILRFEVNWGKEMKLLDINDQRLENLSNRYKKLAYYIDKNELPIGDMLHSKYSNDLEYFKRRLEIATKVQNELYKLL